MTVTCSLSHGSLRITNAGPRPVRLTPQSRIHYDLGDGEHDATPPVRRERWWYPRQSFTVPLPSPPPERVVVTIANVGEGYDGRHEATAQPAQTSAQTSVRIDRFEAVPTLLSNIDEPAEVRLTWQTTGAHWVTLSSAGLVDPQKVDWTERIEQTTTFILTAYDASLAQVVSQSVTVLVEPSLASRLVPVGTIALWSGRLGDPLPAHWYLCDGRDGRPNLTDRFVIGAGGSDTAPGYYGDAQKHTHQIADFATTRQTTTDGNHVHHFPEKWYGRDLEGVGDGYSGIDTNGDYTDSVTTEWAGLHDHTVTVTIEGQRTGANEELVLPPWYALYYIIKGE